MNVWIPSSFDDIFCEQPVNDKMTKLDNPEMM